MAQTRNRPKGPAIGYRLTTSEMTACHLVSSSLHAHTHTHTISHTYGCSLSEEAARDRHHAHIQELAGREKEAREQPLVLEGWLDSVVVRRVENSESSSPRTSSMNTTKNYLAESGLPMRSLSLSWIVIPTNISCNTCMWERTIEHMHDDRPIMHL